MWSVFGYLIVCSTRNQFRTRLRRLKQPRYAIGTIAGLVYFGWIFGGGAIARLGVPREATQVGGTLLMFLFVALMWAWPGKKGPALGFTPAEVQHLFPAPISRRQLIGYRIARAQIACVVTAAFMALMTRRSDLTTAVITFLGTWLAFGAFGFHGMGMSLSRSMTPGRVALARRWVPVVVIAAMTTAISTALAEHWPRLLALPDTAARAREAGQILSTGAAGVALWPFRALMRVPTAEGWAEFFAALPPALLVWALSAVWVVRSDAAFEEASAEHAEKIARVLQGKPVVSAAATSRRPPPFALAPMGRVETALLWKNLILVGRLSRVMVIAGGFGMVGMFVMLLVMNESSDLVRAAGSLCAMLAYTMILMGPLQARFDLRQDLAHLATLKAWPVRGAALVRGEVLAPTLLLSALACLFIGAAAALGGGMFGDFGQASPATVMAWTASVMILSSAVIAIEVVAQNGIAVLFPAWIRTGPKAAGSVEGMGQQMLMMVGSFLMVPIVALPAALVGAVAWFALQWTLGFVPVLIPAVITAAALLAECWLAIEAIGAALDRTDVSAIDPG